MLGDGDTINLRKGDSREPEFVISHPQTVEDKPMGKLNSAHIPADTPDEASNMVKVKFEKFVNLIATHAYEDIVDRHARQEVIISTDLLTDLANAQEEKETVKWPLVLVLGMMLGAAVVWYFSN